MDSVVQFLMLLVVIKALYFMFIYGFLFIFCVFGKPTAVDLFINQLIAWGFVLINARQLLYS